MSLKTLTRKVELPPQTRKMSITPGSIDKEKRTVQVVFSTGFRGRRFSWSQGEFEEELSLDPSHVRLDRFRAGAALLDQHGFAFNKGVRNRIGKTVPGTAMADGKIGTVDVQFSQRADADELFKDVCDGILDDFSVGYRVYKYADVTPIDHPRKVFRAIDWEPFELSLVDVPFDPGAKARSAETESEFNECEVIVTERHLQEEDPMPPVNEATRSQESANKGQEKPAVDQTVVAEAKKEATRAEKLRQTEIRKAVRAAGLEESFAEKLISGDVGLDEARAQIIDKMADQSSASEVRAHHTSVTAGDQDERLTMREGMSDALLHRARPDRFQVTEKGRDFRGMSLLRLAEEIVGRGSRGLSRSELAVRAMSTSDFAIILNNTARKMLRAEYGVQPQTFKAWCQPGTLPDYKEMDVDQLGAFSDLEKVEEGAAYKFGTIGEGREKIKVAKYGKILPITEEIVVNDDLNAVSRFVTALARAAGRVESKIVYTDILVGNPAMSDSVALFHATHGNLPTAATITNGLSAARAAMRKQKDLDGKDYLDIEPGFLIVGPDKETEALQLMSGEILAAQTTNVNVFRNSMKPVVESRITGNKWFLAAKNFDTVMYAYLEGMAGPEISEHVEYKSDVINLKVKHVFGAKAIDHKGLIYNSGL